MCDFVVEVSPMVQEEFQVSLFFSQIFSDNGQGSACKELLSLDLGKFSATIIHIDGKGAFM